MRSTFSSRFTSLLCAAVISIGTAACGGGSPPPQNETRTQSAPPPQSQQPEEKRFALKGKVTAVNKAGKQVTVDHEEIRGFMGAMTMAYFVKDEHLLDNVAPGDQVTADLISSGSSIWLENIVVVEKAAGAK